VFAAASELGIVVRRIALSLSLALGSLIAAAPSVHASPGKLGVMVDAGVPDGLTGSVVYRPLHLLNVHAGIGTNLIGVGLRAGASVYLLPTWIAPSINVEAGHYFAGDANATMQRLGVTSDSDNPLLREVGYDYANLHMGVELGRDRMSFYLHAGFSALRVTVHNLDEAVAEDANEDLTFRVGEDPTATVVAPSARIGFLYFF
jgi:hypothetical protein